MKRRDHRQTTAELIKNIGETDTSRRDFLVQSLLALAGVSVTLMGCGREGSTGSGGESGSVSANHGHSAFISSAQLTAGSGLALDITGSSDHPHSVTLSASQVQAIASGTTVSVTSSSDDGHTHLVSFN